MPSDSIPTISLADTGTQQLSEAILDACTGPGFFYLTDIPIDPKLVESAWTASEDLFLDQSEQAMQEKINTMNRAGNTGYTAIREEKLAAYNEESGAKTLSAGDLKESFYIARVASSSSSSRQELPSVLQSHEKNLADLYEGCKKVCSTIITAFEQALGLQPNFFTRNHNAIDDRLRLIHYPPIPFQEGSKVTSEIRAGSHSDYGTITLLFQRGVSGLQVLGKKGEDDWIEIPPKKNAIVVNVGDALEFWTAGTFQSTQHRVVMPRTKAESVSRFSM
jgi:isopenicillin N synthase-like dioxygenase